MVMRQEMGVDTMGADGSRGKGRPGGGGRFQNRSFLGESSTMGSRSKGSSAMRKWGAVLIRLTGPGGRGSSSRTRAAVPGGRAGSGGWRGLRGSGSSSRVQQQAKAAASTHASGRTVLQVVAEGKVRGSSRAGRRRQKVMGAAGSSRGATGRTMGLVVAGVKGGLGNGTRAQQRTGAGITRGRSAGPRARLAARVVQVGVVQLGVVPLFVVQAGRAVGREVHRKPGSMARLLVHAVSARQRP